MSNLVASLVQRRRIGSGVKKAVLMYFADRSSDDGSGVWSSKANVSRDTEISIRAVQNAIKELLIDGVISEVGNKPCKNGYTIEYRVNTKVISMLESTRAPDAPPQDVHGSHAPDAPLPPQDVHGSHAPDAPLPPQDVHPNHPLTIHEPSLLKVHFDIFWNLWPNKVSKPVAKKAWDKLKAEDHEVIISLPSAGFESWQRNAPPNTNPIHASSFLNQRRWEDVPLSNGGRNDGNGNNNNQQTRGDAQYDEARERALRIGYAEETPKPGVF